MRAQKINAINITTGTIGFDQRRRVQRQQRYSSNLLSIQNKSNVEEGLQASNNTNAAPAVMEGDAPTMMEIRESSIHDGLYIDAQMGDMYASMKRKNSEALMSMDHLSMIYPWGQI